MGQYQEQHLFHLHESVAGAVCESCIQITIALPTLKVKCRAVASIDWSVDFRSLLIEQTQ